MDYQKISADDHIDLGYLPPDLWTERVPKALRDRAPREDDTSQEGGGVRAGQTESGNSVDTFDQNP